MRERRKLVAVSVGRLELEALNAPENGERRTENGAPLRGDGEGAVQAAGALPHAPAGEGRFRALENGEQRTENRTPDKRATGEIVVQRESQTSKHPSFQTSTFPCTPGTSDGRAQEATGEAQATGKAAQEIQEMQEIQERPVGATDVISASGEAAAVSTSPTNTAGRFDVGTVVPSWAEGAEGQGNSQASKLPSLQASGGEAAKVVYSDWGVCGALGWRRRKLVGVRRGLVRGVDWDVCGGEVGMLGAWCVGRGLDVARLARAGGEGLVSVEVVGFVANRQLVLARRFSDGVVAPVRVREAGAFRRGDVFECRDGAIVGVWPRRGW